MKFIRCKFTYIAAWLYIFMMIGVIAFLTIMSYKNTREITTRDLKIISVYTAILLSPSLYLFPKCCQRIIVDNEKIQLRWWFIVFRTFLWSEVKQVGIGNVRAGYGTYRRFIYVSKRFVTDPKELDDILMVKDVKNFITIEYREDVKKSIVSCSRIEFKDR